MIRALIVDDEQPARDRLRRLLAESPDVDIVGEAADGQEAMERIASLGPSVVFLDIQMPGLSGLDVAARLRPPRPRVVFCTAFDQFALQAFEHHAVDYLLKPVARERLGRVMERLLAETDIRQRAWRERREAADVQAKLMPAAAALEGFDCAAQCVPADGVGGDYYDVLPAADGRVAFTVGDVSGKGLYAGILAAAVQGRMQSMAAHGTIDPAAMLRALNQLTTGGLEAHRFITLAVAVLDRSASTLTFAAAGHPPALVLRPGGLVEHLEATGPVVGWPDAAFGSRTIAVRPGDVLALYSDGITESAGSQGVELGTAGLAALLQRHLSRPADEIVRATLDDLEQFTAGAPPADDRTLLVARIP